MDRYAHIISQVTNAPWAIQPEMAAIIQDILVMRRAGYRFTAEELEARVGAGPTARAVTAPANIAVIPVVGVILHRMEAMQQISGGMSPDSIGRRFDAAMNDAAVTNIVLDFDTPGGTVYGLPELGDKIRSARGRKLVTGIANGVAASAGFWLLAQCEEVVVTPSGRVGSIGVVSMHENIAARLEQEGIEVTLIHSTKYKVEGNPFKPLDEEARAAIKADVDHYDAMFHRAVAKGRGVSVEKVRDEFGQGRMVHAQDALSRQMVDAVEAFDHTIARLMKGKRAAPSGAQASQDAGAAIEAAAEAPPAGGGTRSKDYYRTRAVVAQRMGAEHGVVS